MEIFLTCLAWKRAGVRAQGVSLCLSECKYLYQWENMPSDVCREHLSPEFFPSIQHSRWSLYLPCCVPSPVTARKPAQFWMKPFQFAGKLTVTSVSWTGKRCINNSCQHHLVLTQSGERLLWGKTWEKTPVSLFERASGYVRSIPSDNFGAAAVVNSSLSCWPSASTIWFSSSFILFMLFVHAFQCLSFVSCPVLPSVLFSG